MRPPTGWRLLAAAALLAVAACEPTPSIDAGFALDVGTDAAIECVTDDECEDGLACNGEARCSEGRCVAGETIRCDDGIACTTDFCSEELRRCVNRALDADGDGAIAATCLDERGMPLGDDCDDANGAILPGAMELCDAMGVDEDCDPETLGGRDGDGDGYVDVACCNGATCGDDCNDAVRGASPDGTEVCNGIDDDCDGTVDEGVQVTVYRDADGDGRGDAAMPRLACSVTPGYSEHDDDCDDTSALRSPILAEACDGIDNDCDGTPDPTDAPTIVRWYEDGDGDGFGDPALSVDSCTRPMGAYSLLGSDCDDEDAARSPGQAELCNGVDDDCNGVADFAIATGDLEDDDLDGVADARCVPAPIDADCDDRDASSRGGASEVCDGRDNDCDTMVDEGVSVTPFYRDVDRDGHGSEASGVSLGCGAVEGYVTTSDDCDDASDTRYPGAVEGCNSRDDDCDARVDEDPSMSICPLEGGVPRSCVAGRCRVGSSECGAGRANCDGIATNGCEVTLATDSANCGTCGRRCAVEPQGASSCAASRCSAISCVGAFLDCNGDLGRGGDGCEVDGNGDAANCGGCGMACPALPHVTVTSCLFGVCGFDPARDCDAGWADCNGVPSDGCEAQLGTDPHCSSCADVCRVTEECDASRSCRTRICPTPTADCDANGSCETNLSTTLTSCGACGTTCSGRAATWSCTGGECRVASCVGAARDCDMLDSTGCEVDSATDVANCGMCGRACTGGSAVWACTTGTCRVSSCIGGARDCDGSATNGCEINTDTDPNSCGTCGRACPRPPGTIAPTCAAGACSAPSCVVGRVDCNGDLGLAASDGCETLGICGTFGITPTSRDFGIVAAGAMGAPVVFTVRNVGDSPVGPTELAINGANPDEFVISADGCTGASLAAGATCTFSIAFAPTSTGPRSASLRVSPFPGAPGGLVFASLNGTGIISIAPATHDFGARTLGLTSPTVSFMVRNPGTVSAGMLAVSMSGPNAANFAITAQTCMGTMVSAGGNCTVTVRFTPSAAGARSATLQITGAPGGTTTASLSGTGSLPLSITPLMHDFGPATVGQSTGTQVFTVSNPGTITTGMLSAMYVGAHAADFPIAGNTCVGATLAPSGTCTITARFQPTTTGARSGALQVTGSPGGATSASIAGTGSAAMTATPASFGYPTVTLGGSSAPQTFTINNPGTLTTGTLAVTTTGANPGDFTLVGGTCNGATVAAAGSCTIQFTFTPGATGARSANLRVTGTPGGDVLIPVTGTGSAAITASPPSQSFPTTTVGQTTVNFSITISNPGTIATGTLTTSVLGAQPGDFPVQSNSCNGASVAAGGNCTVVFRFAPSGTGGRSATLSVMGSPGGSVFVNLSGTGSAPISLGGTLAFQPVTVGATSGNLIVTVTNNGSVATGALTPTFTGGIATEINFATTTCTPLAPGASCTYIVNYTPTSLGPRSGTLTVSATPGGTAMMPVSGTGIQLAMFGDYSEAVIGSGSIVSLDCPAGYAMVGLAGYSGLLIDGLEPLCAPVALSTDTSTATYTYPIVTTGGVVSGGFAGGTGGGSFYDLCPANHFVTSISGGIGMDLDRIQLTCSAVSGFHMGGSSYGFNFTDPQNTPARGGGGGGAYSQSCTAAPVFLRGLRADSATYVSGVGSQCRRLSITDT